MGMESLFFARADFRDKNQRKESKSLNMIWKGSGKSDGPVGMTFFNVDYEKLTSFQHFQYNVEMKFVLYFEFYYF